MAAAPASAAPALHLPPLDSRRSRARRPGPRAGGREAGACSTGGGCPAPWAAAPAPAPAAAPAADDDDGDDELREIFLEEAREVVQNGLAALAALAEDPKNLAELTTLRRAFHTLKGSSRMVGLNEFGEAAWSLEQVLNTWLADQKPANDDLRALCHPGHARLRPLDRGHRRPHRQRLEGRGLPRGRRCTAHRIAPAGDRAAWRRAGRTQPALRPRPTPPSCRT